MSEKSFSIVLPAFLEKSEDGEWKVRGLASTPSRDAQGEVILQDGIDLTPIDQGRGVLNWDHQRGPENTVGVLDGYQKTPNGLVVEGRLFKNHSKAKSIYEIMSSLGKSDRGRMGLSVEGKILERGGPNGKIIKKCQINAVALTMNPVNQDSFVDLIKSLGASQEVEFNAGEESLENSTVYSDEPTFTATQVMQLLEKALTVGQPQAKPPGERSGGEALAMEDLDSKPKAVMPEPLKKKKLKKMSESMCKSSIMQVLDSIQKLYPTFSRQEIWEVVKDRLNSKFDRI